MIIDQALCPKRSLASQEPCLPSVDRAIDVLELLATCRTGLTLSDLSRRLKIPKST
ncbi:MAG: helix-turn-helix domain-containing protein, partial [Acidobacteriaceae bacterium]|nr:helix-turn-helix domain-containing protein [Acidobacteriaceae bacterium]